MYSCRTGGEATRSRAILACDSGMAGKARTMIIDFHTHIFPPEVVARRGEFSSPGPWGEEVYCEPQGPHGARGDLPAPLGGDGGAGPLDCPLGGRAPRPGRE